MKKNDKKEWNKISVIGLTNNNKEMKNEKKIQQLQQQLHLKPFRRTKKGGMK